MKTKFENLKKYFRELGSAAIAFSGGVDSTFLLKVAHDILKDKVIAVTAVSKFVPPREIDEAKNFCLSENIRQIFLPVDVLSVEGIKFNPKNRCYICKKEIFTQILKVAESENIFCVAEGSNKDDEGDFRPGMQAIEELKIKSPLREVGLWKKEIRLLSKELNLPTFDKPSFACLASRFVYGEEITEEKLQMIDEAEKILLKEGFKQFRVRLHGKLARIEILPAEFEKLIRLHEKISADFKNFGFDFVTLDLQGYRTGSMNFNI